MVNIFSKYKYSELTVEAKATIWFVICNCIQKGMTVITIPVFTRIMSTEQYGVYSVYHSWMGLLTVIITLNLSAGAFNNAMLKYKDNKDAYSSSMQALVCTIGIVLFFLYLPAYRFWNSIFDLSTPFIVCMFIEIILGSAFSFWAAQQRFEFRYCAIVLTTIVYAVSTIVFPAIAVMYFANEGNSALYRAISGVLAMGLSYGWIWVSLFIKGKTLISKDYWTFALKFNIPLIPHYLAMTVLGQMDRIMIKKMVGDSEAGIYTVAYTIAICLQVFTTALNQGFAPWLYRKLESKRVDDIPQRVNSLFLIIGTLTIILSLMAPEVISLLTTQEYFDAKYIIPPIAGSTFFVFMFQLFANYEFFFYKNGFIAIASSIAAVINLVLNYIFIPIGGYYAAGYTTLASYVVLGGMHIIFVIKILKDKEIIPTSCIDIKSLMGLSSLIVFVCSAIPLTYDDLIIRYTLILLIGLVLFICRKKIIEIIKRGTV